MAKQPYFLVGGILSESVVWQQTNIVLRMAWVKIIKLIPHIHLNPFQRKLFAYWVRLSADNIDMHHCIVVLEQDTFILA